MASTIQVDNETTSSISRITREGRKITYQLKVIQQPERARACGSGAKSSADRRPVDPPPIVELRVLEGDLPNSPDVTFAYGANFFLFATLENARTMAQGRVNPAPSGVPVLTGTPVAGMAYLDRPHQAGYFIFPDLSVRHEGKYRLSFALYEETKEDKDRDADEPSRMDAPDGNQATHFSHRLEVKSAPFTVFSAKKFPGLTESTLLSRLVAEQGCRVRIRRDVRMRRRDNKTSKDWDDYEHEDSYDRARSEAAPDAYTPGMPTPQPMMDGSDRPRSVSNASNHSFQMAQRRPSMDMHQGYQQGYQNQMPAPQTPQGGYSPMPYNTQQPQPYQNQYAQPQQPMMHAPQPQYQPQGQYQAPNGYQPQPQMQAPQAYNYSQPYQQPGYEQPHHVKHESLDYQSSPADYRRQTAPQPQPQYAQPPMVAPYSTDPYSRHGQQNHAPQPLQTSLPPQQHAPPTPTSHSVPAHSLAPIKTLQPPADKMEPASPSYSISNMSSDPTQAAFPKYPNPPPTAGTKRSYGSTFNTSAMDQPLRQGARPPSMAPLDDLNQGDDEDDMFDKSKMVYRRADGTQRNRQMPWQ